MQKKTPVNGEMCYMLKKRRETSFQNNWKCRENQFCINEYRLYN